MLEALHKADGAIISLKLPGSPWAEFELQCFDLATNWVDEVIEASLAARRNSGEVNPQTTMPYVLYDDDGNYAGESRRVGIISSAHYQNN